MTWQGPFIDISQDSSDRIVPDSDIYSLNCIANIVSDDRSFSMDGADLISDRSINSRYVKNFGDDGMIVTVDKPDIRVLEERHMITVMLYLLDHDGCRKTELYRDVARSPRFPEKLDLLQAHGLLEMEIIHPKAIIVHLTDKGRAIAENLVRMQEIMVSE